MAQAIGDSSRYPPMRCPTAVLLLGLLGSAHAATVAVSVDAGLDRRAIDPRIYGVNFGDPTAAAEPRYPLRRSGGNATTRYNWQADVHNTAGDYFFMNIADGDGGNLPNDSSLNQFVAETRASGAEAIVTIGTIGWTPDPERQRKWGYSIAKYGPQTLDECRYYGASQPFWCSADAGNGECDGSNTTGFCVGGRIVGNDPDDTSFATDASYATAWVQHLRARHGTASAGGVRHYSLDNEPMLWNSTHRDVHPQPATYDEIWQKTVSYGSAIRNAEPDAVILGPVTWGSATCSVRRRTIAPKDRTGRRTAAYRSCAGTCARSARTSRPPGSGWSTCSICTTTRRARTWSTSAATSRCRRVLLHRRGGCVR